MNKFTLRLRLGAVSAVSCLHVVEPAQAGTQCGIASYYDIRNKTANGEDFNPGEYTVAHPWLPFGSWITVVDQDTGRSVEVRVNDRGPWTGDRILDLSPVAINALDPYQTSDLRHVCIHW